MTLPQRMSPVTPRRFHATRVAAAGRSQAAILAVRSRQRRLAAPRSAPRLLFGARTSVDTVPDCDCLQIADLDGDGHLDLVAGASTGSPDMRWYRGDGAGGWTGYTIATVADVPAFDKIEGCDVIAPAPDGGDNLVIALDQGSGEIYAFRPATAGVYTGSWTAVTLLSGYANLQDSMVYDIDGDGQLEVLFTSEGAAGEGGVYWLDFTGSDCMDPADWTVHTATTHAGAWWLGYGRRDLGSGAAVDIVFSARDGRNASPAPGLYLLQPGATITDPWTKTTIDDSFLDWNHHDFGEFFGNGHGSDLVAKALDSDDIYIYDYTNGWARTALPGPPAPSGADDIFNVRTVLAPSGCDLIFVVRENDHTYYYTWDGRGWVRRRAWPVPYIHPFDDRLLFADLDEDGGQEMVFADSGGNELFYYKVVVK